MSEVRAVVFDLGGVIVRICRTWAEGCRAAGVPVRDLDFVDQHPRAPFLQLVYTYQRGEIDTATFCRELSVAMDGVYSPQEVDRVRHAWMFGEYDGVAGLMDDLNRGPCITAALSNTSDEHWGIIAGDPTIYAAVHRMQRHFLSQELGLVKPDAAIYEHVQSALAVDPASIVFFDDLEENVAAAVTLGWQAHQIDHTSDTAAQMRGVLTSVGVL